MASKTLFCAYLAAMPPENLAPLLELARRMDAHLDIAVLSIAMMPTASMYGMTLDNAWAVNNAEAMEEAEIRKNEIEALVRKNGLHATIAISMPDMATLPTTVATHALYADLTVFTGGGVLATQARAQSFNGALFETGRPILVLDGKPVRFPEISRALIAWNGSAQAAKAVHHALPYLGKSDKVHIVLIDPSDPSGTQSGNDIAAFLARNDLNVAVDRIPGGGEDISVALNRHALDIDADLIVMGGHGHSRLREWLFGSTTRNMLINQERPIFIAN